jgi:hypothetical protein
LTVRKGVASSSRHAGETGAATIHAGLVTILDGIAAGPQKQAVAVSANSARAEGAISHRGIAAAGDGVAAIRGTAVAVVTKNRSAAGAGAVGTDVTAGTGIAVVAGGTVIGGAERFATRSRITCIGRAKVSIVAEPIIGKMQAAMRSHIKAVSRAGDAVIAIMADRQTEVGTEVIIVLIAVVALFRSGEDAIAANRRTDRGVAGAVPAVFEVTGAGTAVALDRKPVVTHFGAGYNSVATGRGTN